ncbi:hypothetical protein [Pararhodobacter sp.]|uniref:hypothetical protein n=1 Tax=Pararhodobacter sp. TaxID=2127056 RepID=UPI002AFDDA7B|nr:hypothetical protein [Pararhodobacter sp.]
MRALGFITYVTIATLLPVLVVVWNMGATAPFWFLAGDAYLYLGIGEASSGWSMSYDGLRATNGFHPLWQVWVRLVTNIADGPLQVMTLVAYSAIALTWAGVLLLGAAIRRLTGSWLLAMLVVPGVYYLVIGQALRNLPIWGFYDGMEAGLAFFIAGLLAWLIARLDHTDRSRRLWQIIGLTLAALVLTRLDEVFLILALTAAVTFWPGRAFVRRITDAAWIACPSALAVAGFIGWSYATTGLLSPVSGAAKGEGAFLANSWVTLATFFAPLIDVREALTSYEAGRQTLLGGAFRVVELVIPALFALGFGTLTLRRHRENPWAPALVGFCGGVILKALYHLTAVNYWHQASWYFAVAMMVMTLGTAILLAPAARRLSRAGAGAAALALGSVTMLHASLWSASLMTNTVRLEQRDFWQTRAATQSALYARDPDIRVMEFGDGLLNFTFDFPVRHGFVFAGDGQSLTALRESRLLRDGYDDGFTVLSSFEYLAVPEGAETWTSDQIRAFLQNSFLDGRIKAELPDFDFEMLYIHRPTNVPFIRLIPRA